MHDPKGVLVAVLHRYQVNVHLVPKLPGFRQRCRHVAFRPLCLMTRFTPDLLGCFDHFWGGSCQHQGLGKSQGRAMSSVDM